MLTTEEVNTEVVSLEAEVQDLLFIQLRNMKKFKKKKGF